MIQLNNVTKRYPNGLEALKNISLTIEKGEFVFLVGPSGAGKTTILKLLYRELLPTNGSIRVLGRDVVKLKKSRVPYFRRNIGLVFQDYRLLTDRTVYENVAFALRVIETPGREIKKRVLESLALVGLGEKFKVKPTELSGGEQQRVSLARAIVNQPAIILADEPTGNLDPETSKDIVNLLRVINLRGSTIVMGTHDQEIVDRLRKRVVEVEGGMIVRDQLKGAYRNEA
ncbi:cell division ATP-binding protein FtsE [Candidatus Contubernalis alkaliaceticus]|uniref:cell division ATP-binding protein FtsE n=1 Tax=Candidatus Contubernalis alkaliaceticus TaxID=338645 RepID=UPI001F4C4C12|nr:cell division ATP-binding protein FtsE [Candidatus Contubernalis alkalaceticus]UNC90774.1 cell division ATP-binding protein FtsE [Candidatus Contubernalis alkalaceticus]